MTPRRRDCSPPDTKPYGDYTPDEWQTEFVNPATGKPRYPLHAGLAVDAAGKPVFDVLPQFPPGTRLDRFGDETGRFLGADGDPFPSRSLPPDSASAQYFRYVPDQPLPKNLAIVTGEIAEAFGVDGGGTQFQVIRIDPTTGLPALRAGTGPPGVTNFNALTIEDMIRVTIIKQIYPPT